MRGSVFNRLLLFFLVSTYWRVAVAREICADAYFTPSNPLSYREPTGDGARAPKTSFNKAAFRNIEVEGPLYQGIIDADIAKRSESEKQNLVTMTIPGRFEHDRTQRLERASNFVKAIQIVTDVQRHKTEVAPDVIQAVVMDTVGKAARFLRDLGVATELVYDPPTREAYLLASGSGEHAINRAAAKFSEKELPLFLAYRPLIRIRDGATAMLDPQNILYVSDETVLRRSLQDVMLLHELRHWKNKILRYARQPYALHGGSIALEGHLPGPRDAYSGFMSFDEPHAYFESLKISLIQAASDLKKGVSYGSEPLREIARTGYRTSYRAEALARLLMQTTPAKATYLFDSQGMGFAKVTFYWGNNLIENRLPLMKATRESTQAEMEAAFVDQLQTLLKAARETKTQFDKATQAIERMDPVPTLEQIRDVQKNLIPVNYREQN